MGRLTSWLRRASGRQSRTGAEPVAGPVQARQALAALEARVRNQVPGQVMDRVERISALVDETLPNASDLGLGSQQYFSLIRTATRYLPDAVNAYLALPRSYADHHVTGGKTALGLLCDQLDLLESTLSDVVESLRRSNRDRLAANGRFLEEKFGAGGLGIAPTGPSS